MNDQVARLMFVHSGRILDSVVTLQFDRFLSPAPAHTFIHYGPWEIDLDLSYNYLGPIDILEVYRQHGIDTSRITLVFDNDLLKSYPQKVDIFNYPNGSGREGNWIKQQMLKLIAVDQCPYDNILIQDGDIIPIRPYCYFDKEPINYISSRGDHPDDYYRFFTQLTGYQRQSDYSFICEFFPLTKTLWNSLKRELEERFDANWFTSIHQALVSETRDAIWFSEYEMLGNWALVQNPKLLTKIQHRLFVNSVDELNNLKDLKDFKMKDRTWSPDINCIGLNFRQYNLDRIQEITNKINSLC